MPDERDQLAQAQAQAATLQDALQGLELRMAAQEIAHATEIAELRGIIKAVEAFAKVTLIGKDGVKVAGNVIGLDFGVLSPFAGNGAAGPQNQYPVNLIENGVLRILTPFTLEAPPSPEVD